jgi:hypothetical protein
LSGLDLEERCIKNVVILKHGKEEKGGERRKGRFPATVYFSPKLLQLFAAANRDGDPIPFYL